MTALLLILLGVLALLVVGIAVVAVRLSRRVGAAGVAAGGSAASSHRIGRPRPRTTANR